MLRKCLVPTLQENLFFDFCSFIFYLVLLFSSSRFRLYCSFTVYAGHPGAVKHPFFLPVRATRRGNVTFALKLSPS